MSESSLPKDKSPKNEETFVTKDGKRVPDRGMSAAEPIQDPAPTSQEDSGMQAVAPLEGQSLSGVPNAPQDEMPWPPPEAMRGAPIFTANSFVMPDPAPAPVPPPSIPYPDIPSNPQIVRRLVTFDEMQALWNRIPDLEKDIEAHINNLYLAREMLNQLKAARMFLMAGREYYDEAKRAVDEVEYHIKLLQRVKKYSRSVGWALFAYELAGVAFFGWLLLFPPHVGDLDQLLRSTFWGGIGGVAGALYALWRHIARDQDFDPQYKMWYVTNPIMGVVLGAFVFLVMKVGLISVGAHTATSINADPIYVLAWLSGFQQNVAYDIVRRLLKVFKVEEDNSSQKQVHKPGEPSQS